MHSVAISLTAGGPASGLAQGLSRELRGTCAAGGLGWMLGRSMAFLAILLSWIAIY
jgi:hypothetical protein